MKAERLTKTGGRAATTKQIMGDVALSVGHPCRDAPKGWKWTPLTSVARMESGHTPSRKHPEYWGGEVPWIGIRDAKRFNGREITETIEKTNTLGIANSSSRILPKGTVCLSRTASVGYVVKMGADMATSQDFANWVCSDDLDPDFLTYLFIAEGAALLRFASGSIHQTIYYPELKAFHVCLPPLEEQQRIVAVLDEAFEGLARARAHAEANLQNARELFESIKAEELAHSEADHEEVRLSDVADITSGLVDPRENPYADMLHLGGGNMITGTDELVDVKTAREENLKSGKYLFDETTVLYSKIRPYLRKAARPNFQGLCSADVYPLKTKPDRLDRDFLFHTLLGNDFTEYAISGSDRAGMPKVNRDHLFAYRFELPPLDAQRRIATVIDEAHTICSALVELTNKKLQDLDDLRQSLLQKAFAGDLT